MQLHRDLLELYEGIRCYPVAYYHHSRRAYHSLPYTFRMIGGVAGALRWGLPTGHYATQAPWLPTLITGLLAFTDYVEERFLSDSLEKTPQPVPFETYQAALTREKNPSDWFLGRFLRMERWMRDLARLEEEPDVEESYARYKEWLPFTHRIRSFFEVTAADLGYELDELAQGPGERLF